MSLSLNAARRSSTDSQGLRQAPNLQCFITRIGQHPERLQNVYFTYVLLLRALSKSGPQLLRTLQDTSSEAATIEKLSTLVDVATGCPSTFDETSMFSGPSAEVRLQLTPPNRALLTLCTPTDPQNRVQGALPQRLAHHGLRRLRQMPSLGQDASHRSRHGAQAPLLLRRRVGPPPPFIWSSRQGRPVRHRSLQERGRRLRQHPASPLRVARRGGQVPSSLGASE